MGQRLTRPIRNFNVENRAAKALEKQQKTPKAAPKHASTVDSLAQMKHDYPEALSDLETKNERLHENLKKVYIDTKDPPIQIKSKQPTLQQLSRGITPSGDHDLGVMDVDDNTDIPKGRSSLKSVMSFIAAYQENPTQNSVPSIAQQHGLSEGDITNILAHFKVMQLHIPKEMYKESKSMGKIMTEQIKASEKIASSFKLEQGQTGRSDTKSIPDVTNTGTSKT